MFDDFYGLTGKPFQLTPDPAFYFESVTHRKALSYLGYGLAQGEGFIVITGEVGAGKSTLVAHLMAHDRSGAADGRRRSSPASSTARRSSTSSRRASGSTSKGTTRPPRSARSKAFLHDEARAGRRCLLIVDESQNLSVAALEELRMLSNFQLGAHPLLQTLLLGQPEFRATLHEHPAARAAAPARDRRAPPRGDGAGRDRALHRAPPANASAGTAIRRSTSASSPSFTRPPAAFRGGSTRSSTGCCCSARSSSAARIDGGDAGGGARRDGRRDSAFPDAAPQPMPRAASRRPSPARAALRRSRASTAEMLDALLAERDAQIAELQQAIVELANQRRPGRRGRCRREIAALQEQLAALEARVLEQERTIRHTLTMLIEWIEGEMDRAAARLTESVRRMTVASRPRQRPHRQRPVGRRRGLVPGRRVRERDRARQLGRPGRPGRAQRRARSSTCSPRPSVKATFFTLGWVAQRHARADAPDRRRRATRSPATAGTTRACSRSTARASREDIATRAQGARGRRRACR